MAKLTFERCLAITLRHEGGYADHPADPGGATNMGVTRAVLAEWRGRPVTKQEVRALSRAEAADIYRKRYWDAVGCDDLAAGVDLAVFDYAVNSGPGRASRALQAAVGVVADGFVGVETIAAARSCDARGLIRRICAGRRGFLGRLRIFPVFGRGWLRRVADIEQAALAMAGGAPVSAHTPATHKETADMTLNKSVFESRTVWSNLVGMLALGGSVLGFNTGLIDQGALVDAILKAIAGASFVASTIFRISATRKIG